MRYFSTILWLALRDLRAQPIGFRIYALALALGIGTMVAVTSFRDSMGTALDEQARALLGADLSVRARRAFSNTANDYLAKIPGATASEAMFRTMAWFPAQEHARFTQVRALDGGFPFYGTLDTVPPEAAARFQDDAFALVEENALIQAGADVGDRIRIGAREFVIAGRLLRAPGESPSEAFIAPRVYIPLRFVPDTGLVQPGSVVTWRRYFRLEPGDNAESRRGQIRRALNDERLDVETAESRKRALLGSVDQLARYLGLVGFAGLLLGCVGVAGAVHVYVTRRLPVVAMLRCLGAPRGFCEAVFLVQVALLALVGALAGVGLAAGVLPLVAGWMQDFLAAEVRAGVNVRAALLGIGAGLAFSIGFALLPLLAMRRVAPAQAMSRFEGDQESVWRDPLRLLILGGLTALVTGFAITQSSKWTHGAGLVAGLAVAFAVLLLAGRLLRGLARYAAARLRWLPLQHGIAGLYRPNNQTGMMLAAIGLGAFLLTALVVSEQSLRAQLSAYRAPDQPSLVLIDIQSDQRETAAAAVTRAGFPPLNEVPIVTMRLQALNGVEIGDVLRDPARAIPEWALRREYRSTYRAEFFPTEKLLDGVWAPRWDPAARPPGTPVPISMEKSIVETLGLRLDDEVTWDVQGLPVHTRIASIREVDWRSMKPNFYVVFPEGVLEAAPQTWALFTRAPDARGSAALQRAVATEFTNVSVIDLALVLSSVNTILGKIGDAVRGVAWFTLAAGLLVVAGAVRANREQRERERVLLRTLGAPQRHLVVMSVIEHAALGLLGGLAGVSLGALAGHLAATHLLKTETVLAWPALALGVLLLATLTALLGLAHARPTRLPPLEQLRRLEV
ncbi:MAG TPA: ABC transporter permease [Kiritimatiellia bacterium]|nr:ABC transporter permease [Kiritimatiellia bacterium]